jgi:hypothetical protein
VSLANGRVPRIAAAKLALIEPHFEPCGPQSRADPPCSVRVFRGVAEKDGSLTALAGPVATKPRFVRQGVVSGV